MIILEIFDRVASDLGIMLYCISGLSAFKLFVKTILIGLPDVVARGRLRWPSELALLTWIDIWLFVLAALCYYVGRKFHLFSTVVL